MRRSHRGRSWPLCNQDDCRDGGRAISAVYEAMSGSFRDDIGIQGSVIRRIAAASSGELGLLDRIRDGAALLGGAHRPIALVGMGSSLHAARTALHRFAQIGRFAVAFDAGELEHFGLPGLPSEASVIAISQSGKSAETVAVAEQLRAADRGRQILAIVNDLDSPLARLATVAIPMGAGVEAAVATRTFIAASVLIQLLADELAAVSAARDGLMSLAATVDELSADDAAARAVVDGFADLRSLELVGRGAGLGIAHYGALTIKETAAFPAEALSGGAFRHGPLELVDAPAGAIVLVPSGPAARLGIRLAQEIAAAGWKTWAIGATAVVRKLGTDRRVSGSDPRLVVTGVPSLDSPLAVLPLVVPLQQLAAVLAERRGRIPGHLLRGSKVTETQ